MARLTTLLRGTALAVGLSVASAALCGAPRGLGDSSLGALHIHVLEYGTSRYPAHLVHAAPSSETVELAWLFYLVAVGERRVLVDTGFVGAELVRRNGIRGYVRPDLLLRAAGVAADAVTDIVVTHAHFDHVGAVQLFPKARIYLQRREYERALADERLGPALAFLVRANEEGRLALLDGSREILPGIRLEPVGGHSLGSQALIVEQDEAHYWFMGDECYLLADCRRGAALPAGSAADPARNRTFLRRAAEAAAAGRARLLPAHDHAVLQEHGAGTGRVVQIR